MTRFWPAGAPIVVTETDDLATPRVFRWERATHRVEHIYRRWRDDLLWWRERIWREYFLLRTRSGLLVLIYHDIRSGEWRLQRLYD
jgi:hypothetical protein